MTGETSPIELWEHPLSPYAQKVKIALMEKGVPFSSKTPDAIGSGSTAEEFRKTSFRGEVPVLIIEGHAIVDSTIILEFLEERFPQPRLLPTDPFERARARMIEEVCEVAAVQGSHLAAMAPGHQLVAEPGAQSETYSDLYREWLARRSPLPRSGRGSG